MMSTVDAQKLGIFFSIHVKLHTIVLSSWLFAWSVYRGLNNKVSLNTESTLLLVQQRLRSPSREEKIKFLAQRNHISINGNYSAWAWGYMLFYLDNYAERQRHWVQSTILNCSTFPIEGGEECWSCRDTKIRYIRFNFELTKILWGKNNLCILVSVSWWSNSVILFYIHAWTGIMLT